MLQWSRNEIHEILRGWEEHLSNVQIHSAMKLLASLIEVNGIVMQHHEMINQYVKNGWVPCKEGDDKLSHGSRFNPQNPYPIVNCYLYNGRKLHSISLIEYNFAMYIIKSQREQSTMLDQKSKVILIGNTDLINYCTQRGIDREKLKQCNVERIEGKFVFALSKEDAPQLPDGFVGCDLRTQPDIVLIMDVAEDSTIIFEETSKTSRIKEQKF